MIKSPFYFEPFFQFGKNFNHGKYSKIFFEATPDELKAAKEYYDTRITEGADSFTVIDELLKDGWTSKELLSILPAALDAHARSRRKSMALYGIIIMALFSILLFILFTGRGLQWLEIISPIFAIVMVVAAMRLFRISGSLEGQRVTERRVKLFFGRLHNKFGMDDFAQLEKSVDDIATRNQKKIFLPTKDKEQYKVFGGHVVYRSKTCNVYVTKKYSHGEGKYNHIPVYRFFIFYECLIRPVPFYFSIVDEIIHEAQAMRLQNRNYQEGDFQDMDFAAREFNEQWRLRGSDKKLAYQIFGPHMHSLIMQLNQQDMVGLEISDSSVILSNRFTAAAVNRCYEDFTLVYEIARQVERNYREVKW